MQDEEDRLEERACKLRRESCAAFKQIAGSQILRLSRLLYLFLFAKVCLKLIFTFGQDCKLIEGVKLNPLYLGWRLPMRRMITISRWVEAYH